MHISSRAQILLLCGLSLLLWLIHAHESLWLDELQTYWVISSGFQDTIIRAFDTQGFTPFYYVVLWAWHQLGLQSEMMLRLPSLLCIMAAIALLYELAKESCSATSAFIACLAFVCLDDVLDAALFARPYALALMFCLWSCVCLRRWQLSGKRRHQYLYLLSLLLTVYAHYLFLGILVIQAIYLFATRSSIRFNLRNSILTALYFVIGCFPIVPQVRLMLEKRSEMQIAPQVGAFDLLLGIVPWLSIVSLVVCFFFALAIARPKPPLLTSPQALGRWRLAFAGLWVVLPPLILFFAGHIIGNSMFVSRYYLWSAPGFALFVGLIAQQWHSEKLRRTLLLIFSLFSLAAEFSKPRIHEDWRAATRQIQAWQAASPGLLVLYSGVSESARTAWLMDELKRGQFSSPLSYYGVSGDPLLLPLLVAQADFSNDFWQQEVRPELSRQSEIRLLCLDNLLWQDDGLQKHICPELIKAFKEESFDVLAQENFGRVSAVSLIRLLGGQKS